MKKYFALPLSVALVASALPPQVEAASLKDISGHPYEAAIQALVNEGIITGYPDQTYKPEQALTRWDVVVLLGRYLERHGYRVPSDYKTNMRFSDLTPSSGDMLLKYAALVKDNGIFLGGNGQLLHKELLSHHHAALVLVRAVSKLAGTDLTLHNEEDFFVDIQNLQEQDRKAISIFAKLGLVSEQYFKPSAATTRGEFAYYLQGLRKLATPSDLTVKSIQVLNSSHIFVTFNDGRTHDEILPYRLPMNVNTTIHFTAFGKKFVQTVKMTDNDKLMVESVTNPNAAQFVIRFSNPVNLAPSYSSSDIQKMVQLTPRDGQGTPSLLHGKLSGDKKTLTVTTSSGYILNKRYNLRLNGVFSEDGVALDYSESVTFVEDKTKPVLLNVEQLSLNEALVQFSEPINSYYSSSYKLANGKSVYNISSKYTDDRSGIIFDLSNARVDGKSLDPYTDVIVEFSSITDRRNNVNSYVKTSIRKSEKDKVKPDLVSIEQFGAKKVKLTFTKPMRFNDLYNVRVIGNYIELIEQDPTNPNAYIFTMENLLNGEATITTRSGYYLYDLAGNRLTFNKNHTFSYDAGDPTVLYTEVGRDDNKEYLYFYFDKNIDLTSNASVTVNGTYTVNNQKVKIQAPINAKLYSVEGNSKSARVLLAELLRGIDRDNVNYELSFDFTGLKADNGRGLKTPVTAQFTRSKDYNFNTNKLQVVSIETSRTNASIKNSNLIVINFNYAVDIDKALDLNNYNYSNFVIERVNVNRDNQKQVELYIKPNTISSMTSRYISIDNITAMGSVYPMESHYEDIYVNENVRPILNMYTSTSPREITLTYNEALAQVPSDLFVVRNSDGVILSSETTLHATDNRKVVITFEQNLPRNRAITIQFKGNRQLTDVYYNEADRISIKYNVPSY